MGPLDSRSKGRLPMPLDPEAEIMVQGITGREASGMVEDMLTYGSRIVAGVTPGKGGRRFMGFRYTIPSPS